MQNANELLAAEPQALFAWLGITDMRVAESASAKPEGPIASAVVDGAFSVLVLLSDHAEGKTQSYCRWLKGHFKGDVRVVPAKLSGPTNYRDIFLAADRAVSEFIKTSGATRALTFHMSPGTPAMAAVWLLLAKSKYPAQLIESSKEHGVSPVSVPFDIASDFVGPSSAAADNELVALSQGLPPEAPEFESIVHRCDVMKRVVIKARRFAQRDVPVLIQGESGTGKELFARAIHRSSHRASQPFVAVNCGAIPGDLVDSELFGHEKGAFTGATSPRAGHFESASKGTLFLDEIGELPLASQVRLLRALQEGEVTRVGASNAKKVDVRVIAATNRVLPAEVVAGRFREDLFHRLAVGVLILPPLRERGGDLSLLVDAILARINEDAATQPGFIHKKLSVGARNVISRHSWPGNVRELYNTLLRASIWAPGAQISVSDVEESLAVSVAPRPDGVLGRAIGNDFDINEMVALVARHYLSRSLSEANGNKTEAAKLLGLGSYQTLSNWLERYGVKP